MPLFWALNCSQYKLPNAQKSKKKKMFLGKCKWFLHSQIRAFLYFAKHLSMQKSFVVAVLNTRLSCGLLIRHGICTSCELNNSLCSILTRDSVMVSNSTSIFFKIALWIVLLGDHRMEESRFLQVPSDITTPYVNRNSTYNTFDIITTDE